MTATSEQESNRFFGAAKVVAALTMLSRVLGLVRDMVLLPIGSAGLADRFWTAFSVPNLFRRLFGEGALSAAFVPVYSGVLENDSVDRARLVLANVAGLLGVCLWAIMGVSWLVLWAVWEWGGGSFERLFLLQMIGLMMPFMFTVCMLALGSAVLNCRGHFAYPAAAPIILNIALILAGGWLAPRWGGSAVEQFYLIGGALVVAGLVQLLGVILLLKRQKLAMRAIGRVWPILPETRQMLRLMAPMVIPLAVLQLSAFGDRLIALIFTTTAHAPLKEGVVRCLYAANRLFQLPLGVLAISVATVVFPLFSRFAARDDQDGLRSAVNRALRLSLFLGIPAGVALMLLAEPTIRLFFQRGQFSGFDTTRSAFILQMYCLGMWAYFCNHILLRAFYAIRQPRTPMILAVSLVIVNFALVIAGIHTPLKGGAIGLATAITSSLNALLLTAMLRRKWGRIGFRRIARSLGKITVETALMAGAIAAILYYARPLLGRLVPAGPVDWLVDFISIVAAVLTGGLVYLLAAALLKSDELADLVKRKPVGV
jgi:putative peptidoglycan lipid II flippase